LITLSFAGHSFRVNQVKLVHFYQFTIARFYFCLISNLFSCRYASRTLRIKLL